MTDNQQKFNDAAFVWVHSALTYESPVDRDFIPAHRYPKDCVPIEGEVGLLGRMTLDERFIIVWERIGARQ